MTLSGRPLPAGRLGLTLESDLGGVQLRTAEPLALTSAAAIAGGTITVQTNDLSPLAAALGEARLASPPAAAQATITLGQDGARTRLGIKGRVADARVTGDLLYGPASSLTGTLALDRLSLPWLASALALNLKPGDPGALWPSARLGPAPAGRFQGEIALKADELQLSGGLTGSKASLTLASNPDGLSVRQLEADLAGGHVAGEFTLSRQEGLASLIGGGTIRGLDVAQLTPGSPLRGRLSADLRFGGSGESVAGIVANLGGAGTVALADVQAARADPAAIGRVVARALKGDDPLAGPRVQALAGEEFDKASLGLGGLSGPATLVGGVVRAAPLRADSDGALWTGALSLDLRNLSLDARGLLQAKAAPSGWTGDPPALVLGWQGPVANPARNLDVGPLVNGLAAVVLARELDRIDTFEADQNERQRRTGRRDMDRDRIDRERKAAEEAARQAALRAKAAAEQPAATGDANASSPDASQPTRPAEAAPQKPEAPPGG
jgi:hypothetical protein